MAGQGMKEIALGRSDIYRMSIDDLHVKDGWNSRVTDFNPEDADDLALAQSISQVGVKQPLTVYWEDSKTWISDGHRRYGAAKYARDVLGAEIKSVPVQTEERFSSEADRVFSQIVRNSGKPLSPIEQASVFKRLIDLGWTIKDLEMKTGMSRNRIVDLLELQAAPVAVTEMVKTGKVSATLAITTLKKHEGDGRKTATELSRAVDKAESQGKTRATAKHLETEKPKSLKDRLRSLFQDAAITSIVDGYVVELSDEQYAELRTALDL